MIARAEAGEEIVIARGKEPVVRLAPVQKPKPRPKFGAFKELRGIPDSFFFDLLPEEELKLWEDPDPYFVGDLPRGSGADVKGCTAFLYNLPGVRGKSSIAGFNEVVAHFALQPVAVTVEHDRLAGTLPGAHRDPFDRMLAAQAQIEDMPLVTADPVFRAFGTRVLW